MQPRLAQAVLAAVTDLRRAQLFARWPDPHLLRIEFDGDLALDRRVWAQIEKDGGLMMSSGPTGLEALLLAGQMPEDGYEISWSGVQAWGTLSSQARALLEDAGLRARREKRVPYAQSHSRLDASPPPRRMPAVQARRILATIRGILAAVEAEELAPDDPLDSGELPVLTLGGNPTRPTWAVRREPLTDAEREQLGPFLHDGGARLDEAPPALPLVDYVGPDPDPDPGRQWNVVSRQTLFISQHQASARVVLVIEDDEVVFTHLHMEGQEGLFLATLGEALADSAEDDMRIPGRFVLHDRWLRGLLLDELDACLVDVHYEPHESARHCELVRTAQSGLCKAFDADPPISSRTELPTDPLEWRLANSEVKQRFFDGVGLDVFMQHHGEVFSSDEELVRYFVEATAAGDLRMVIAFTAWAFIDFRSAPTAQTACEEALGRAALTPVERALLEAWRDAPLSLYRVEHDALDEHRVRLEDLAFGGGRESFHFPELATVPTGHIAPLYIPRVAGHPIPLTAGPTLTPAEADELLDELRADGHLESPEHLRRAAHRILRRYQGRSPR